MENDSKKWAELSFLNKPMIPASQISKQTGKPMYTKEQLNVADPLTRLWRYIVFNKGITYEHFILKWKEFCRTQLNLSPYQVNISVGNIKTPLYSKTITINKFYKWMMALGFPIMKITVKTIDNEEPIIFDSEDLQVKKDP